MTATKNRYRVRRLVALGVLIAAVAAVGVLVSGAGSTPAPPDAAARFVPNDAIAYLHLDTDRGSAQWERTSKLMNKLPTLDTVRQALLNAVGPSLGGLDLRQDVRPWLGDEAAFALLPMRTAGRETTGLLLLKAKNIPAARRAIEEQAGSRATERYRGVELRRIGRAAAALDGAFVLAGPAVAVRAAIDTEASGKSLAQTVPYREARDRLPHDRVLHGYLASGGIQRFAAGPMTLLAGAAHAPGIGDAAFSFGTSGKRVTLAIRAESIGGEATSLGCKPKGGAGDLLNRAPAKPAVYLGIAGLQCVMRDLIASPTTGVGKAIQRTALTIRRNEHLDVVSQLFPLLAGDSAVVVSQTPNAPVVTLGVSKVDKEQALGVMGRLQPAIVRMLQPTRRGAAPGFDTATVDGVQALTANLAPALQLSYAAFDGDLVVSTALQGILAARKGQHLDETGDFKTVLGNRPGKPTAVLFLDLEKLLALADQAGLGSNPAYLAVRDDLQKVGAAGAVVSREGKDIDAELRFRNP